MFAFSCNSIFVCIPCFTLTLHVVATDSENEDEPDRRSTGRPSFICYLNYLNYSHFILMITYVKTSICKF